MRRSGKRCAIWSSSPGFDQRSGEMAKNVVLTCQKMGMPSSWALA